jgi:hypothetical protein
VFFSSFKIEKEFNESIKQEVLHLKKDWSKDLNKVKALTSGFRPDYKFFDIIKSKIIKRLLEVTNKKFKPTDWWANFYEIGHFANSHHHKPEHISSIVFIKTGKNSPLYFDLEPGILRVKEEEGLVLLFDSRFKHGVDPIQEERITLAVDFVKNF